MRRLILKNKAYKCFKLFDYHYKMEVEEQPTYMPESDQFYHDQEESIIITPNKKKVYLSKENSSIVDIKKKMQKKPRNKIIIAILTILVFVLIFIYPVWRTNMSGEKLKFVQASKFNNSLDKVNN